MRIRSIRLHNGYKRFHDFTISLGDSPARLIVLVGPNGCGKSSVFDGMLYLFSRFGHLGHTGRGDDTYHNTYDSSPDPSKKISIDFSGKTHDQIFNEKRDLGREKTIFSFRSPYRYNTKLKIKATEAIGDIKANNYGASTTNAIDAKMEKNYQRLFGKYRHYMEKNDVRPSEAKSHIIGELNNSIEKCLDIRIESLGNIENNQGSLYFTKYDQSKPFEFDVLSSGEKEVVDLLIDLYLRKDDYDDSIFLIDEPELHINTSIQKKLLIEINRLIGPNCQIWISTHSIGFLKALQDEFNDECQIIYFEPGLKSASEVITLTPISKSHENWKKIFSTALDDLTGLICPKRIVYCEGRDKPVNGSEKGLDAQVYNKIFCMEHPQTLFVSSGGNTELEQRSEIAIAILSKAITDLDILILKDRDLDSAGEVNENDREIYLQNNPSNHRVLKRREIENYLFDKEVLRSFCSSIGQDFKDEDYVALIPDIINGEVKSKTAKIKTLCHIKGSVNPEKFKLNLAEFIKPDMDVYQELEDSIFSF